MKHLEQGRVHNKCAVDVSSLPQPHSYLPNSPLQPPIHSLSCGSPHCKTQTLGEETLAMQERQSNPLAHEDFVNISTLVFIRAGVGMLFL